MRGLVILWVVFGTNTKINAFSSECAPHNILAREEETCHTVLREHNMTITTQPDCQGMWDHLNCWPPAWVGETVSQPCPKFFKGEVYRNCTDAGWTEAFPPHYLACEFAFNETVDFPVETQQFLYVKYMYTAGYAVSLISLVFAVVILCFFRKLHCTRNYIHIQLFLSFILRAAFIFIKDSVIFPGEDIYHCDSNTVACKCVILVSHYCIMANYSWLLVEGHYLHTLVHVSFFSERKHLLGYIVLGWGVPVIVVASWGLAKYLHEDEGCWVTRGRGWIWWLLRVPALIFIVMNVLFFLNIIRILVGKLRMSDVHGNEINQYKRLAKSIFLLVVLFGLQDIIFAFLPDNKAIEWTFAELALGSTQGFVVAVRYCFLNAEVQYEIQRRWRRWRLKQRFHGDPRQSLSLGGGPHTLVSLLPRGPSSQQSPTSAEIQNTLAP